MLRGGVWAKCAWFWPGQSAARSFGICSRLAVDRAQRGDHADTPAPYVLSLERKLPRTLGSNFFVASVALAGRTPEPGIEAKAQADNMSIRKRLWLYKLCSRKQGRPVVWPYVVLQGILSGVRLKTSIFAASVRLLVTWSNVSKATIFEFARLASSNTVSFGRLTGKAISSIRDNPCERFRREPESSQAQSQKL